MATSILAYIGPECRRLKFKDHINDMIKKFTYKNNIFKRTRYYMNDYTALIELKTRLLPLVDHRNMFITGCIPSQSYILGM